MIPVSEPRLGPEELAYVSDCLASGWISSSGAYIERFEQSWADYVGARHGIAVSSGTAALQLAVDAFGLGPGDEVILPSFTIISCALAVLRAGATPVLVDCDAETYCIDAGQAEAAVTPRTRALMPVHIYGHPADMDPLIAVAERHGLAVIEDAAQAHGCEYRSRRGGRGAWRRCGSFGTLAAFSFYANKPVTTGEGGMILTDSAALAERCRSLRNLCFDSQRFRHEGLGYNFRLSNLQAAIGVAQIGRLSDTLARKRRIGAHYNSLLNGVAGIGLPVERPWARGNYCFYAILLDDDAGIDAACLAARLRERGVDTRPFFLGLHEQPVFRARELFCDLHLPVTERIARRGLYLPSGPGLTEVEVEAVADAVKDAMADRGRP
jgi:perosamine synthetase